MRKKLLSMVMAGTLALSFTTFGGSRFREKETSNDTFKVEETSTWDTQAVLSNFGDKKNLSRWGERIFWVYVKTKI